MHHLQIIRPSQQQRNEWKSSGGTNDAEDDRNRLERQKNHGAVRALESFASIGIAERNEWRGAVDGASEDKGTENDKTN